MQLSCGMGIQRQKGVGTTVITCGNSLPIFESAKHDFYFVPLFVKLFAIRRRLFSTASTRNTRRAPLVEQRMAKSADIIRVGRD